MIPFVLSRAQNGLIVVTGIVVALCGVTNYVDAIVPWVFGICDSIPWVDVYKPLFNPEPMNTYAYRPLSVVLLKLGLVLTGREPWLITLVHSCILPVFGVVSARFLVRHGFSAGVATAASLSSLAVPSLLFSAWICVEFDLVGATVVLAAASALHDHWRGSDAPGLSLRFWVLAFIAMTIKETSALQLLAYLTATALSHRSERRRWRVLAMYFVGLLICTGPMHFVPKATMTAFSMFAEGFHPIRIPAMYLHTAAQLVFAVSFCGVFLVFLGGLRRLHSGRSHVVALLIGILALVLAAPVLRHYSHFEAIIFSDGIWSFFAALALLVGVALHCSQATNQDTRTLFWMLVLTYLGYASAPIVLRFARADVSARIFAAIIPVLHALAWREVWHLWTDTEQRWTRRLGAGVLGVGFGLYALSAATNTVIFHRTRLSTEGQAKRALAEDIRMDCPAFINTNPVQLLTTEELVPLGASSLGPCAWVQTTTTQPESGMSIDEFAAAGGIQVDPGQDIYLYVQTARSTMPSELAPILAGNFDWALELMPEADDDLIAGYQRMIYEIPTDIQQLFVRDGNAIAQLRQSYIQLPLWWNELLARAVAGVPIIETYDYLATVHRINARQPGFIPPGGRIRADTANRDRRSKPQ